MKTASQNRTAHSLARRTCTLFTAATVLALAATTPVACSSGTSSSQSGSGKAQEWDDCVRNTDCATGLVCAAPGEFGCEDASCCVTAGGEYEACYADGTCDEGAYCDVDVCVLAGSSGHECYPDGSCDQGSRCVKSDECSTFSEVCCASVSTTGAREQPCNADRTCNSSLYCVQAEACPESANGERQPCCLDAGGIYEPCLPDGSCTVSGLSCVTSKGETGVEEWKVCRHTGALGEPCGSDGACNGGYSCKQDSTICENGDDCCTL